MRRARPLLLVLALIGCARATAPAPPTPTQTPTSAEIVIGQSFTIASKLLGETRRINVYVPPGAPAGQPLPVLYMLDGGLHEDFHHITGIVQVASGNGTMRPTIVVGVENTERRRDLTAPSDDPADRAIAPRIGGSATFRRFLRDELMPEVRRRHRTTAESAIVGESLAGLFVLETLLTDPTLFDVYIAVDPSVWWNHQALVRSAAAHLPPAGPRPRALYIATSSEAAMQDGVQILLDGLQRSAPPGLRWHHEAMPQETHATIFHEAALRAFRAVLAPASE